MPAAAGPRTGAPPPERAPPLPAGWQPGLPRSDRRRAGVSPAAGPRPPGAAAEPEVRSSEPESESHSHSDQICSSPDHKQWRGGHAWGLLLRGGLPARPAAAGRLGYSHLGSAAWKWSDLSESACPSGLTGLRTQRLWPGGARGDLGQWDPRSAPSRRCGAGEGQARAHSFSTVLAESNQFD